MSLLSYLQTIKTNTIVVHHNGPGNACPDGTASAILLQDAFPAAEVLFMRPDSKELDELPAKPGMIFCDLTPTVSRIQEFVATGAICLDHHEKQKDRVLAFGPRGVYSDKPGVSGAMLAYQEVWLPVRNHRSYVARDMAHGFAELAGIRDTWLTKHKLWSDACALAEALRFYPHSYFDRFRDPFGADWLAFCSAMMSLGEILMEKKTVSTKRILNEAYRYVTDAGTKVCILSTTETSDAAEQESQSDVIVGFRYLSEPDTSKDPSGSFYRQRLILSFRSRTGIDVGEIAKSLNGGGHKFAAGCSIDAGSESPYQTIYDLLESFPLVKP